MSAQRNKNAGSKDPHRYDDIIGLSRPVSKKHRPMPLEERAAQFAPFAALTGYTEAVKETEQEYRYDEGVVYDPERGQP